MPISCDQSLKPALPVPDGLALDDIFAMPGISGLQFHAAAVVHRFSRHLGSRARFVPVDYGAVNMLLQCSHTATRLFVSKPSGGALLVPGQTSAQRWPTEA